MSSCAVWNYGAIKVSPAAASAGMAGRRFLPLAFFSAGGRCQMKPSLLVILPQQTASSFLLKAVAEDYESGNEKNIRKGTAGSTAVVEAIEEEKPDADPFIAELKRKLMDQLDGTNCGVKARSETRGVINELITQLEARNPNPAPTEALDLLKGKWILAYTSFAGLFPLLGSGIFPQLLKVDEVSQTIDSEAFTVQNSVQFVGPFSTTSLSTNAKFEVRSPKRVQIKFEEGIIGTPQLTDSTEIPNKVELFGQNIDLSPFKGMISSLQDTTSSVAKTISSQPPIKIPIWGSSAQSWLLTTYLDHELRISRGDGGSIFVLIKEGSLLLA